MYQTLLIFREFNTEEAKNFFCFLSQKSFDKLCLENPDDKYYSISDIKSNYKNGIVSKAVLCGISYDGVFYDTEEHLKQAVELSSILAQPNIKRV